MHELVQLLDLRQVVDVVAVQLQDAKEGELEDLGIDAHELVVGEVQPGQIARRTHDLRLKDVIEAIQISEFVVIQQESSAGERKFLFPLSDLIAIIRLTGGTWALLLLHQ